MGKSLLAVAIFALITINGILAGIDDNEVQYDTMLHGVKVYRQDRECAMLGGLCVHSDDCLQPSSKQGLCPSNRHHGVECCYEISTRPAPCQQHLGECMDRCPKELTRPGTDCKNGKLCCVLI